VKILIAIVALCAAPYVLAQSESLPAAQSQAGVKYVHGGIGKDESDAMLRESKNYPLSLVFSGGKSNNYLANIDLRVRDGAGKTVLQTTAEGPIVLVDLPAGKYVVDAQYRDKMVTRTIELSGKTPKRVDFHWTDGE
jgi:hypothetical protein